MSARFYHTFTQLRPLLVAYELHVENFRITTPEGTVAITGSNHGQVYVRFPDQEEALLARIERHSSGEEGPLRVPLLTLARLLNWPNASDQDWLVPLGVRLHARYAEAGSTRFPVRVVGGATDVLTPAGWRTLINSRRELVPGVIGYVSVQPAVAVHLLETA